MATYYTYHCVLVDDVAPEVGEIFGRKVVFTWQKFFTITSVYLDEYAGHNYYFFDATVEPGKTINAYTEYSHENAPDHTIRTNYFLTAQNVVAAGICKDGEGTPLDGVLLTVTGFLGTCNLTVGADGLYDRIHANAVSCNGIITPSLAGYTFDPINLTLSSETRNVNQDFVGTSLLPSKPINPTPANEASDITLDGTGVTWVTGGNTDSYNVYAGTLSGFLSLLESGVDATSYTLRSTNWPNYGQARYWRVDAVNEYGTTTGDEWYFTTLIFCPPTPPGVTWTDPGNDTGYTGTPLGTNNMLTVRRLVGAADNCLWIET